jgi:hypothetical protein
MSPLRSGRALALPCAILLLLGGCVALPMAQLASQAMSTRAPAPGVSTGQVAQASDTGVMAQAARGLQGMVQQVTGGPASP